MLSFRLATFNDARLLFDWRNDPTTRAMSRNQSPIDWGDHVTWLDKRVRREEPHLYIAEDNGTPVGTIRVDGNEVSYTVAPEHRGSGYATAMLRWARETFGPLKAEIKPENVASIRAAERAGHEIILL